MFNHGRGEISTGSQECKPDFEQIAARLKVRLDANRDFFTAFAEFAENGSLNETRLENTTQLFAIVGGLSVLIPQLEKEYNSLLEQIEKKAE